MPIEMTLSPRAGGAPVKLWTTDAHSDALTQLKAVASLPIVHAHIAAMPDVHYGKGATVGSVIATRAAIIPAAVGSDIGCGMHAVRLSLEASQLPDGLGTVRSALEERIPVGRRHHGTLVAPARRAEKLLSRRIEHMLGRNPQVLRRRSKLARKWRMQMGTLGGGNHFIELCLDEADRVWVMLHSGSRSFGNVVGEHFIERARSEAERLDRRLPHRDLGWLDEGTPAFDAYWEAIGTAQDYALENRRTMLRLCLDTLAGILPAFRTTDEAVECHHNYASLEHHAGADVYVTRKGAIRARKGELGIIPGSMGTHSYIVRGTGAKESFESCAHGAGRAMSRSAARERFTEHDVRAQTRGVECRKDAGIIDEIPGAYRDIESVMHRQRDLCEPVHTLRQVLNIKG